MALGARTWFDAVLFDLDGVLTPTAEIHQQAWTTMFDDFLAPRGQPPFTEADYLAYVDGKPRFDGVRSFLASRGVELPEGEPAEPPGEGSVRALGNRKNDSSRRCCATRASTPIRARCPARPAASSDKVAVVSSSRNAREVLDASGLAPRFDVVADGVVAADQGIAGKPAPDLFLAAAVRLGVEPRRRRSSSRTPCRAWPPDGPAASAS